MKRVADFRNELIGKLLTDGELESVLMDSGYTPFDAELPDGVVGVFTDTKKLIYIKGFRDVDGNIEVADITQQNKITNGEPTKVDPFHTYEDLDEVFKYFSVKNQWNHWLACKLMVGLGRRSGDTLELRWCDIYRDKECTKYFDKCIKLREEKTGKIIAPTITEYVQVAVEEYRKRTGIKPVYTEKIFNIGTPAVRAAVKKAVKAVGIEYPVSLHSFRKTYGNWTYKIHKNEPVCLEIIKSMFGHSDTSITRLYIDQTNEDAMRYANDLSAYMLKKERGEDCEINSLPNVTVRAESLREMFSILYDAGKEGKDKFDIINEMIGRIEREGF